MIFFTTRFVGSGDKDESLSSQQGEAQARDHCPPYCNSSQALDSSSDWAGEWPALPPQAPKEVCRSQLSSKEPRQTSDVSLKSLPG